MTGGERSSRRRLADRISIAAMGVCIAGFAAVLFLGPSDAPSTADRAPAATSTTAAASTTTPRKPDASVLVVPSSKSTTDPKAEARQQLVTAAACRDVAAHSGLADRCRTRSALLTIRLLDETVRLGEGTRARALRVRTEPLAGTRDGRRVTLSMRLRNATGTDHPVSGARVYLFSRGTRIPPAQLRRSDGSPVLRARSAATVTATFDLQPAVVKGIRADGGLVDLGVRPFAREPGLERVGVIRLELDL